MHISLASAAASARVTSVSKRKREARRKRSHQLGSIERDVLSELTFGDLVYTMLISGTSNKTFFKNARERANYRYRRKLALHRLIDDALIQKEGLHLSITNIGRNSLGYAVQQTRQLLYRQTWDGKWRIVAFDIPEKYASLRDKVRDVLKRAGFQKLQQSIWIFPHECEELVLLMQEESILSKYVLYGVLERIGNDKQLKKRFHL